MARVYATIAVGIWDDPDFLGLSAGAQRTYFMLITQADISACGSLALTLRRWSRTCLERDLEAWLAELEDARFVLIDEDTEELLVRTFVKWDGGYKHAKRVLAVIAYARAIRSPHLREAVAAELAKLGVSIGNGLPPDSQTDATPDALDSRRSVVTEVGYESTPQSSFQEREPSALTSRPRPNDFCAKHMPDGTSDPCGPCAGQGKAVIRWDREQAESQQLAKRRAAKAIKDCPHCDELGFVLDPETNTPTKKCTAHSRRSA